MPHDPSARGSKFKKKSCRFCHDKDFTVDYKNPKMLERFITDRGKILPRRVTGTCARHQRAIARAIKKARTIALLPFVEK
ncbi:MAG: 30S ribosomal protein S18 [Spirochaetes bacterium]|nr:30S ribosomal protein S18 [Spirochaetota bacterium]